MTAINIRLPDALAKKVGDLAQRDGLSLDQFVTAAVSEKLSNRIVEESIERRVARGDKQKFMAALANVPDVPPAENDRLT